MLQSTNVQDDARPRQPIINILLLGETQAGKSTIAEGFRRYGDPNCPVDTRAIGDGLLSHTANVRVVKVSTNFAPYAVKETIVQGSRTIQRTVDVDDLSTLPDQISYEKAINQRKDLELVREKSTLPEQAFCIYDTPGLNATNGYDELHVARIFSSIQHAQDMNLILVAMGPGPFTPRLQSALRTYVEIFPELLENMVFLHTQIDFARLHSKDIRFVEYMRERQETIHRLMGRGDFKHFMIDCDFECKRPIRNYMVQRTLQDILETAMFYQPIVMAKLKIVKTPKMQDADGLVRAKYTLMLSTLELTLEFKDKGEGALLAKISGIENKIVGLQYKLDSVEEDLRVLDVEQLEVVYEKHVDTTPGLGSILKDRSVTVGLEGKHIIAKVERTAMNGSIKNEEGGAMCSFWKMVFIPILKKRSTLDARVYVQKKVLRQEDISRLRSERSALVKSQQEARLEREALLTEGAGRLEAMKDNTGNHNWCMQMISRASEPTLTPDVFLALAETRAFIGSAVENSEKVESVYLEATRKAKGVEKLPPIFELQSKHPTIGEPVAGAS